MPLLDRADSQLVIVDVQPGFYVTGMQIDRGRFEAMQATVAWLAGVASALGVPVTITEEDPARNGPTAAAVLARVAAATPILTKPVFGLADVPEIAAAVASTGRRTVVLAGAETDVCIAHSAIGLLDRGYRVAVVIDATFSPGEMQSFGLRRMREAGVVELHAKGVYYEWVRTLAEARRFQEAHPDLAQPPGFSL